MGCVRNNTGAEELNIENLIQEKKLLTENLLEDGKVPSEEDERKMHKIDRQISAQLKIFNNSKKKENVSDSYYESKKNEYYDLCLKWRMVMERKPVEQNKKKLVFIENEADLNNDIIIHGGGGKNKNENNEEDSSAYAKELINESKINPAQRAGTRKDTCHFDDMQNEKRKKD